MKYRKTVQDGWVWIEARHAPADRNAEAGRYVFVSRSPSLLESIARREIDGSKHVTARISLEPRTGTDEHILHLYGAAGDREKELAVRYGRQQDLSYKGWNGRAASISSFYEKLCLNKEDLVS